jgi:hypothetical protein
VVTVDTYEQEHKSLASFRRKKLVRMLRSMWQRYPLMYQLSTQDGFGVSLGEDAFIRVLFSGRWTDEELRDCLALFVTWLSVDPEGLRGRAFRRRLRVGASSTESAQS